MVYCIIDDVERFDHHDDHDVAVEIVCMFTVLAHMSMSALHYEGTAFMTYVCAGFVHL